MSTDHDPIVDSIASYVLPVPFSGEASGTKPSKPKSSFLSVVLDFLKGHARLIIGMLVAILIGFGAIWELRRMHEQAASLKEALSVQRAQQQQAMQEMSSSFESQREAQRQVDRKFEDRLFELNAQYAEALRGISQARRVRQRQIEANPSTLPGVFETTFGIRPIDSSQTTSQGAQQ